MRKEPKPTTKAIRAEDPIDAVRRQVPEGQAATFSLIEDLEGGGKTLRIEHQQIQPAQPLTPIRAESPRRDHTFNDLGDFIKYVLQYGTTTAIVVAIDLEARQAVAVLNEIAATGTEEVTYKPVHTREWQELVSILGKPLTAREFSKTIRRLRPSITEPDDRTVRAIAAGLTMAKDVQEMDSTGQRGVFGRVVKLAAKAGGSADSLEMPERLMLRVPPFVDSEEHIALEVFIDLVPRGDSIGFELEAPDAARVFERAMAAGRIRLVEELGANALVTYGKLARRPWAYLDGAKK